MHIERMTRLAELLDAIGADEAKRAKFDMEYWFKGTHEIGEPLCQTAACAVGWAALDPWFQAQGLTLCLDVLDEPEYGRGSHILAPGESLADIKPPAGKRWSNTPYLVVSGFDKDDDVYQMLAGFFLISKHGAEHLFSPFSYHSGERVTPEMVALRVRKLLDHA